MKSIDENSAASLEILNDQLCYEQAKVCLQVARNQYGINNNESLIKHQFDINIYKTFKKHGELSFTARTQVALQHTELSAYLYDVITRREQEESLSKQSSYH